MLVKATVPVQVTMTVRVPDDADSDVIGEAVLDRLYDGGIVDATIEHDATCQVTRLIE